MRNAATAKPSSSAGAGSPQAALAGLALGIILCCFFSYKAWERSEKRFDSPPLQRISAEHRHTKPIEQIKVGDWVLAKDPQEPGSPRPRQVLAVHKNWTEHLVHIGVAGQTTSLELLATGSHPIWTSNRGWVEARELLPADALEDEFGRAVMVDRVWEEQKTSDTFNLTVDGVHTFYALAGETPVLVHNVNAWDFGDYNYLAANSLNDKLDIHHYPQYQPASEVLPESIYTHGRGLAIAVPRGQHMGLNGANYRANQFTGGPQQIIDEAYYNLSTRTTIPPDKLNAVDAEARRRYLSGTTPCK